MYSMVDVVTKATPKDPPISAKTAIIPIRQSLTFR